MLQVKCVGDKLSLITIRCWWRFWPFCQNDFGHQHPLSFTLALGTSLQKMSPTSKSNPVTNIGKPSPTLRHQHIWRRMSVKLTDLFWRLRSFSTRIPGRPKYLFKGHSNPVCSFFKSRITSKRVRKTTNFQQMRTNLVLFVAVFVKNTAEIQFYTPHSILYLNWNVNMMSSHCTLQCIVRWNIEIHLRLYSSRLVAK